MTQIEGDIVIGRPVEEVFDFVADDLILAGPSATWFQKAKPSRSSG